MSEPLIFDASADVAYQYDNDFYYNNQGDDTIDRVTFRGARDFFEPRRNTGYPVSRVINLLTSMPRQLSLYLNEFDFDSSSSVAAVITSTQQGLRIIPLSRLNTPIGEYKIRLYDNPSVLIANPQQIQGLRQLQIYNTSNLPPFDNNLWRSIRTIAENNTALNNLGVPLEVVYPDQIPLIPFETVRQIIRQVVRFTVDPQLQQSATPGNTVITLYLNNGQSYGVNARYNPQNAQIFPPR